VAPAIFVTAQFDPLTSDSNLYSEILKKANVQVAAREFSGMIHGFFTLLGITQRSFEAIDYCSERIKELIR
jgi:acetyl esterase